MPSFGVAATGNPTHPVAATARLILWLRRCMFNVPRSSAVTAGSPSSASRQVMQIAFAGSFSTNLSDTIRSRMKATAQKPSDA